MAEMIYPLKFDAPCKNITTSHTYIVFYAHIEWKASQIGAPCFQAAKLGLLDFGLVV